MAERAYVRDGRGHHQHSLSRSLFRNAGDTVNLWELTFFLFKKDVYSL